MKLEVCFWALAICAVFFILFGGHLYRIYDFGLDSYYELKFRRAYNLGVITSRSEFTKYIYWLWFFTICSGIGTVVTAALYLKIFYSAD
jgi:hypothetical protein